MKAITKTQYGGPAVLRMQEVPKPEPQAGEVLVKVHANSANPADWHVMRGEPKLSRVAFGLFKPKHLILGSDFAGVVEALGPNVEGLQVGDRVFGELPIQGAFAQYLCAPVAACAKMPPRADFTHAACLPIAGLTAWQALIAHGQLQAGERVLINGASGGVGHLAVQVAKAQGAHVTAVCSARNAEFVTGLGADAVVAYDQEDIHRHAGHYHLVLDNQGNLTHADFRRMGDRGVVIGFTTMGAMMRLMLRQAVSRYSLKLFTAEAKAEDLAQLARLMQEGHLKPHIEKVYPSEQIPEAIGYIEAMRTRGKVAMVWE